MANQITQLDRWLEWQDRYSDLTKAPARGGTRAAINPASTFVGRYPFNGRNGDSIGVPARDPNLRTMYEGLRPTQPPNYISDVNMQQNWFSPFQPVAPFGPPNQTEIRTWDYPVGWNLNFVQQRMNLMGMLRSMARTWGVLATVISTRQDQLLRVPWTIQVKGKPKSTSKSVEGMKKFFKRPDGVLRYSQWARKALDDLLILDAPSFYIARDRGSRPVRIEVLDGATIFPLIDDAGRRPQSIWEDDGDGILYEKRQPAFQQIIKGLPMNNLDESEIMYVPMRPRPDMPMFGYPATEQILIETTEAILKTVYQKDYWSEGNIPDLIVTVPPEWSPRQIAMFQAHFDALLSGQLDLKSKVRFLPGGMKPFDVKNSSGETLWSQRDETLIRLCCYAYSVSPAPFIKMLNRSTAQSAQQAAEEEGLYPLMSYWKDDIMDPIIQEQFGMDDLEFMFLPRPEPDGEKAAKIHDTKIRNGEITIDEARATAGLEPYPDGMGSKPLVFTQGGVIPLDMAVVGLGIKQQNDGENDGVGEAQNGKGNRSSNAGPKKPKPGASRPAAARPQGQPQSGAPTTSTASTVPSTKKLLALLTKATPEQLRAASRGATGDLDDLSHLQLSSGNYPKGHIWIQGLNISIENQKGSLRGEKDQSGKKWEVRMPSAYGYIRGTVGADGDQVDCYLGKRPESNTVWVIDQNRVSKKGKVKKFDEHKCMIGFKNLKSAAKAYLKSHFDGLGHDRMVAVVEMPVSEFKDWLKNGDTKAPAADQKYGRVVASGSDFSKADTVASSTGLLNYDQSTAAPRPKKSRRKRRVKAGSRWLNLNAGAA